LVGFWIKTERVGSFNWCTQAPSIHSLLFIVFISHTLASHCWQLVIHHSVSVYTFITFIHGQSVIICLLNYHGCTRKVDRQGKQNKMMVVGRSTILLALCLMMLTPIGATRLPQYGLESIDGFCEGWGELDQLGDISSQVLNAKYPYMGPIRVSW